MSATNALRRIVPLCMLPLAMAACALGAAPWLRAFSPSVAAVPLFGAAVLSVLVPVVVWGIGVRPLWLTVVIDAALLTFYELFVALHAPGGFADLYAGVVHGPAQLLSFAVPLVSPRTLLVAPVALCWLSGALFGESIARGWRTLLPYLGLFVALGLSYAATTRAITDPGAARRVDTLLAAALVIVLLLLRAVSSWIDQDAAAIAGSLDSRLPVRGLGVGVLLAVVVAAVAAGIAQAPALSGPPAGAVRRPPIERSTRLTPLSYIAGLRPSSSSSRGRELFRVTTDTASSNYLPIASVDRYDGDGWVFDRTFRPSGGALPADTDTQLRPSGPSVDQTYRIAAGALRDSPWLPALYRARQVTGVGVDVDPVSGMIVPDRTLYAGETYAVRSTPGAGSFDRLPATSAVPDYSPANLALPPNVTLTAALATLVTTLQAETGTQSTPAIPFLQAVARDFRSHSALAANVPIATASGDPLPPSPSASPGRPAQLGAPAAQHAGGTSFADVLASIRQFRSATPEQFATLMCLVARQVHVPARVVTGFRIPLTNGARELAAGTHRVTSAQAWTWVEIPVAGRGWTVLDASPGTHAAQQSETQAAPRATPSATATPSRSALITRANTGSGHAAAPRSSVPGTAPTRVLAVVLVIVAVLVALLLVLLATRKLVRRRRRRAASDPRRRLLGAWRESLDLLQESGLPDLTHASSRDVVRATDERFGERPAAQVRVLGDAANRAIFSPSHPVADADADRAWQVHRQLHRAVRERLDWRTGMRSRLRYHRRPGTGRRGPARTRPRH